jgi:hypothetical protein
MYYIIKRHDVSPFSTFISFKVDKYIASKYNENIIFEFNTDSKVHRKWVKKEDIILLTEDKKFFLKTLKHFKDVELTQQKLVDTAQKQLNESVEKFTETMHTEIDEFNKTKDSSDVPCILKKL